MSAQGAAIFIENVLDEVGITLLMIFFCLYV